MTLRIQSILSLPFVMFVLWQFVETASDIRFQLVNIFYCPFSCDVCILYIYVRVCRGLHTRAQTHTIYRRNGNVNIQRFALMFSWTLNYVYKNKSHLSISYHYHVIINTVLCQFYEIQLFIWIQTCIWDICSWRVGKASARSFTEMLVFCSNASSVRLLTRCRPDATISASYILSSTHPTPHTYSEHKLYPVLCKKTASSF